MNGLEEFTLEELRLIKFQLVSQIKELQAKTRLIDKEVKERLQCSNG